MTLIAAFRSSHGVVVCADSQETLGIPLPDQEYAQYRVSVDKIEPQQIGHYEVVIGGAGHGALVDGFTEALTDQIETWDAGLDSSSLKAKVRNVVMDYHRHEVAVCPAEDKDIQFLVCLKEWSDPTAQIHLWEIRGPAVRRVKEYSLIGWEEAIYKHDIQRMYQQDEPTLFSMLLGVHLFLLAKATSNNIGGATKIVIVTCDGMSAIAPQNVAELDQRVALFDVMLDALRLRLSDTSISPDEFEDGLNEFRDTMIYWHLQYLMYVAKAQADRLLADPNSPDDPYFSLPPFEKMMSLERVSRHTAISVHAYSLGEVSRDLALSTREVIKASHEAYLQGSLTLEQKDRIAELLKGVAEGGKRGTEMIKALNAQGMCLFPDVTSAEISKLFSEEVIAPYLQLESELSKLPDTCTAPIRASLESVRMSLLLASKRQNREREQQ